MDCIFLPEFFFSLPPLAFPVPLFFSHCSVFQDKCCHNPPIQILKSSPPPKAWEDGWGLATCRWGRMARLGLLWGNRSVTFLAVILAVWGELSQQVEFHFAIERPVVGSRETVYVYTLQPLWGGGGGRGCETAVYLPDIVRKSRGSYCIPSSGILAPSSRSLPLNSFRIQ